MAGVEDQIRWSLEYMLTTYDENNLKKKRTDLRNNLFDYIKEHGEEDENGNLILQFDKPMTVDEEEWFSGLMLQRRVSEYVDEDKAWEIVRRHDLGDRCVKTVEILDLDEVYACNQEGLISDEDIDSILSQEETWALVKMKA